VNARTATSLEPLGAIGRLKLIAEVLAAYPGCLAKLRSSDLDGMVRAARDVSPNGRQPPEAVRHPLAIRLGRAVTLTLGVLPTDSRCLIQSLVLTRMLSKRSMASTVVIGVRTEPEFSAHAWVEHNGRAVLPPGSYTRLIEL
jgi:Transglutaminase-like superfamily